MYKTYVATSDAEREVLYRLRYQVFTLEQHKYRRVADHERGMLCDAIDSHAVHLCVADDTELLGSVRQLRGLDQVTDAMRRNFSLDAFTQFPQSYFAFSGRLFILPAHRGSRALSELAAFSYTSSREAGIIFDLIFCNPHLVRFYEQLGYRRYRAYFEDVELGFQVPLVLVVDDVEYLESIRSPLARLAKVRPSNPAHGEWFRERFYDFRTFVSPMTLGHDEFLSILSRKINNVNIALFAEMSPDEVSTLLGLASHLNVEPGTRIVRQGDLGKELFIILDGLAEVTRRTDAGEERRMGTLGRGDFFGDIAVLTSQPRSATVVAASALELVFIDQHTLKKLVATQPVLASKLLLNLSQCLAERVVLREKEADIAS